VFGSHARGEADAYSDIDVIVVAATDRPPVERFVELARAEVRPA
jgi:predicted nucleotidyltransferase